MKLRYFHAVAEEEHVTRAAEKIAIAQPALTQAIKSLEKEFGVSLLQKQGRNIVLTEYGIYLKKRLDQLLPELDSLADELAAMKEQNGKTIRLSIQAASNFVIDAIVKYRAMYPDVVFDFEQTTHRRDCDLIVSTNGLEESTYTQPLWKRCIKEETIYLAVPRHSPYASRPEIDLTDVRQEGFVMLSTSRLFGVVCNKLCAAVGFVPRVIFESDSPAVVQNIVGSGIGIAFWPEYSWGEVNATDVKLLPISNPICQRELIMELFHRPFQSPYAESFYEFLLKQYH